MSKDQKYHNVNYALQKAIQYRETQLEERRLQALEAGLSSVTLNTNRTMTNNNNSTLQSKMTPEAQLRLSLEGKSQREQQELLLSFGRRYPNKKCVIHTNAMHTNSECVKQHPNLPPRRDLPKPSNVAGAASLPTGSALDAFLSELSSRVERITEAAVARHIGDRYHAAAAAPNPNNTYAPRSAPPNKPNTYSGSSPRQPFEKKVCDDCGGFHGPVCWVMRPDLAPPTWAPAASTAPLVVDKYKQNCQRYGVTPKQPGTGAAPPRRAAAASRQSAYKSEELPPSQFYAGTAQMQAGAVNTTRQLRSFTQRNAPAPDNNDDGVSLSISMSLPRHAVLARKLLELDEIRPLLNITTAASAHVVDVLDQGLDVKSYSIPNHCASAAPDSDHVSTDKDRLKHYNSVKGAIPYFTNSSLEQGVAIATPDQRMHLIPRMMLDTGSDVAIMEVMVAKAIGLTYAPVDASLKGIGGATDTVLGMSAPTRVVFAATTPQEVSIPVTWLIVSSLHGMASVILGVEQLYPHAATLWSTYLTYNPKLISTHVTTYR